MSVGGRVIGTLDFGHHEPGFYTEKHTEVVQPIADHLAITVAHSQLFDQVQRRAGELAHALQQALLPAELPHVPFTAMAAHYRAADPDARIGGDWYDAMLLPDDRILLSIGDVTGRGLPAAVGMGQVRDVVRAYAIEERLPGEILGAVNTYVCKGPAVQFLSVWVGILDPLSGQLQYSSAGHPPVRVLREDGLVALDGGGPPLGTSPTTQYRESQAELAPGNRFIAYTDGLIEATRDVIEGEERLARAVFATADRPPDRAVGALVDQVLEGMQPRDDIALMLLDLLPTSAPLVMSLPPMPESLRRVRRAVRAFVERHGMVGDRAEAVVIAVGEAVLNVVEHAYTGRPGKLAVQAEVHGDTLTITVRDFGRWRQAVERGRGRGTKIMQTFADSMRTRTGPEGTQVELSWSMQRATGTSN
jgi:serine phosphatase RsbU (regulator of sigma subunit)/anti-sigma regulatory factor (Ser/Thr protein kinase)